MTSAAQSKKDRFRIAKLSIDEVDEAAAFFAARLDDTFAKTFPLPALDRYRRDCAVDAISKYVESDDRTLLGAYMATGMVGLLLGGPINGGVAAIAWLVVAPAARGHGLGGRLLSMAVTEYEKRGAHKLVVYTETVEGLSFYKHHGMELEGEHPNHWWGIKHYCLARYLRPSGRS